LHKSAIAWSLEGQIGTSPTPSASASTRASANAAQSDREHDQLSMSAAASGGEASAAEKEETHRPHTSLRRPRTSLRRLRTSQRRRGRCCRTCPCTLSRGLSCAACCHHASSCIRPLIRAAAFQIPFTAARHPPTLSWRSRQQWTKPQTATSPEVEPVPLQLQSWLDQTTTQGR
ncbi:hypothetical protein T492DRAFT_920196, partial [Pavlovales sp. CCMP2436]